MRFDYESGELWWQYRSYWVLHRGLFSWNKNVPMAHIFNDTMDFSTRPGRNAQRGHCAMVLLLFIQTRGLAALHKSIYLSGAKHLVLLSDGRVQHVATLLPSFNYHCSLTSCTRNDPLFNNGNHFNRNSMINSWHFFIPLNNDQKRAQVYRLYTFLNTTSKIFYLKIFPVIKYNKQRLLIS